MSEMTPQESMIADAVTAALMAYHKSVVMPLQAQMGALQSRLDATEESLTMHMDYGEHRDWKA